ncbi:MAG: hypothetical protein HON47_02620 [Candidatus Diapherotrites archaeon]|uniref:Uncharacterized protein n=1 Tax=Candidatus Iainarchaeum sp. TaxID=3101447 RepID=A0A8T5GEP0_9ARCH|nr:hypothetical protein [Candidatus Diapherotrites archaeon]MBT7241066.1 hypothetical protein [Candidatus Diapherotrites archaeon]
MPIRNLTIQKARTRAFARERLPNERYSAPKGWHKTKSADFKKLKAGDMILTVSQRHTLGGLFSRSVAKAIDGKYAHVATYMGKKTNTHTITDFKGRHGYRERGLHTLAKTGIDLKVVRWKNASPKQLEAFLHNLERIPQIGKKYDYLQAGFYAFRVLYKRATGKEIPKKLLVDVIDRFACSEHPATAANPTQKEIRDHNFEPVNPAMEFLPGTNRELITPTIIDAAVDAGILEFVTEQTWKKH